MTITEMGPLGEFDLIDDLARNDLVLELEQLAEERRQAKYVKTVLDKTVDQGEKS